jgi:hypothetical protein
MRTYAVWLVEVILLFAVGVQFTCLHENGQEAVATRCHWVLHIGSYSIQVPVEDARVPPFAEEDQGVCEQFERWGDRGLWSLLVSAIALVDLVDLLRAFVLVAILC